MSLLYRELEENEIIIENKGVVLCSKYSHKMFPEGLDAIHHCDDFQKVDGKEWEVFNIHYETHDAYYGMPLLGLGLMNCFIKKEDTRKFLPEELEFLNTQVFGIYGSHTDKDSGIRYGGGYKEVVSQLTESEDLK